MVLKRFVSEDHALEAAAAVGRFSRMAVSADERCDAPRDQNSVIQSS